MSNRKTFLALFLLVLSTVILFVTFSSALICHWVFSGPSDTAKKELAQWFMKSDATAWIPGIFLDESTIKQLQAQDLPAAEQNPGSSTEVLLDFAADSADWDNYPDGIRIETVQGRTFTGYVMLIRDPSSIYLATSSNTFDISILGHRIQKQMQLENAIAGINAGAFNDDGTMSDYIGSLPIGMVISKGEILWDDGKSYNGFVGFTEDHRLVVSDTIDRSMVEQLNIRDGCCFGPVLIKDGKPNESAQTADTTYNARTAIGQRADGSIIFLCIDGRQAGSLGAVLPDVLDMMVRLGAVNACNLDGGASTVMMYRDQYGLFGKPGQLVVCNNYALIQASARRMPTFFMVRSTKEGA